MNSVPKNLSSRSTIARSLSPSPSRLKWRGQNKRREKIPALTLNMLSWDLSSQKSRNRFQQEVQHGAIHSDSEHTGTTETCLLLLPSPPIVPPGADLLVLTDLSQHSSPPTCQSIHVNLATSDRNVDLSNRVRRN